MRLAVLLCVCALAAGAQKYSGPRPPKPDIPYIVHADNLVETEAVQAQEQTRKDQVLYIVPGANSPVATPLASPIFLLLSVKLDPKQLQLYKLDSKNGRREILFRKKKDNPRAFLLEVTQVAEGLYRLEVDESLEDGEYTLTPEGSDQVFCFQVR